MQRPEPSGSEARLGDILVTILERLSSLEAKISASHHGNSVNDMEARLADIQQSNSDYMAHIFREIESIKIMIDDPQFNMHNTSPINTTSPLNMRNRRSPQYTEDLEYIPTGMGRTYRYGSLSSVGTNDIGYDGEYNSDVASPTPSEIKDMENTNISGTGYVVDCDNDVSSPTPSEIQGYGEYQHHHGVVMLLNMIMMYHHLLRRNPMILRIPNYLEKMKLPVLTRMFWNLSVARDPRLGRMRLQ